jgi:CrcB protein
VNDPAIWLGVAAGGALGALIRASLFRLVEHLRPASRGRGLLAFGPARATLLANTLGCALLAALQTRWPEPIPQGLSAFAITGICGSLTTFSTLCADAVGMLDRGERTRSGVYLLASVLLGSLAWGLGTATFP